jgi:hypothetical protein
LEGSPVRALSRRLAKLEEALQVKPLEQQISSIALDTGDGDLMCLDGTWVPCPNPAALLARRDRSIKVYAGLNIRRIAGTAWTPDRSGPVMEPPQ